jgi:hypothetical protein
VVIRAEHKIGENNNHNSKNKSLFQVLNSCLLELNQSLAMMRNLQECHLVCDYKYRVAFPDSSELKEFNALREKLSKKVDETKKFDIMTVQIAQEDDAPEEFDKSYVDQKNDSSRIADLLPGKEQAEASQRVLDLRHPILENEFLVAAPQTMVLDGVSVTKKTMRSSQDVLKGSSVRSKNVIPPKTSEVRNSFTSSLRGVVSNPRFASNPNLSQSVHRAKTNQAELEDVDTFSSNLKNAPQRMVQKRSPLLLKTRRSTTRCRRRSETRSGTSGTRRRSRANACT